MSLKERLELRLGYKDSVMVSREELNQLFYVELGDVEELQADNEMLRRELLRERYLRNKYECISCVISRVKR